jgi:hypothetical protein
MVGLRPDPLLQWMFVNRLVVVIHLMQPGDDVLAAVPPSGPRGAANAQMNAATREVEIVRDLAAGLSRSDHEYLIRWQ